jgi:hypothetical protein
MIDTQHAMKWMCFAAYLAPSLSITGTREFYYEGGVNISHSALLRQNVCQKIDTLVCKYC